MPADFDGLRAGSAGGAFNLSLFAMASRSAGGGAMPE